MQTAEEACPSLLYKFMKAVYDNYDHPMKEHPAMAPQVTREIKRGVERASACGLLTIDTLTLHEGENSQDFMVVRSAPKPRQPKFTKVIYLP